MSDRQEMRAGHSEVPVARKPLRSGSLQRGVLRRARLGGAELPKKPRVSKSLGFPGVRRHLQWRKLLKLEMADVSEIDSLYSFDTVPSVTPAGKNFPAVPSDASQPSTLPLCRPPRVTCPFLGTSVVPSMYDRMRL